MKQAEIAEALDEIGRLMQFRGDNPFKARAYRNAAKSLRALAEPLETVIAEGRLRKLPAIGDAIAVKIQQLAGGEPVPLLERLRQEIPLGVLDLLAVPGLGPKRVRTAYEALGIFSLDALEAAAARGQLATVEGFGPRTIATVLGSLARVRQDQTRFLGYEGRAAGRILLGFLVDQPAVATACLAGGLRRRDEVVAKVGLVAASEQPEAVFDAVAGHPTVAAVESRDQARIAVRLAGGIPAEVRVGSPARFPFLLLHATGSQAHVERLRERASERGYDLSESGLVVRASGEAVACADEAAVYAALGLACVPPELREDRGEIEAAARGPLPALVDLGHLRGVVHVHTTWSDGRASIPAMAGAAQLAGYEYVVICDHSRSAAYAGGLSIEDLARQRAEIDRVNAGLEDFRVLAGTEVDILPDGSLDYPDAVLATLDVVVASVHGRLKMTRSEQTARVVRALANPYLDILAHPTARLLLRREGMALDMDRVLDAAAEHGVGLELNADPHRLDLDWRWHAPARERGIRFSIDPDAHGPGTIGYVEEGIGVARKGGLTPADVLNTRPVGDFLAELRRNR